jgi:hypothetical protein
MRTAAALLLAPLLLVLAACDREPAEPGDGDVTPPITREQVDALLRSHPELRARFKEWGRDHPEDAAKAQERSNGRKSTADVQDEEAVRPDEASFLGSGLVERLLLGVGAALGLTLVIALLIGVVHAVRGSTSLLSSHERRVRRRYFAECERNRERWERERAARQGLRG